MTTVSQCQHLESRVERPWPLCNSHTWRAWCFRCAPVGEGPAWWVNVPGYGSERETRERLRAAWERQREEDLRPRVIRPRRLYSSYEDAFILVKRCLERWPYYRIGLALDRHPKSVAERYHKLEKVGLIQ